MSKYTTELRFICETCGELDESVGYNNIDEVISKSLDKIFDFYFPIFDESYRKVLETKIIKHYYTREIGAETVGLWKLWLNRKLNEIMPYYNKLYHSELLNFNPLYTHNLTRNSDTNGNVDSLNHNSTTTNTDTSNGVENTTRRLFSDTPQGGLNGVENETYLTDVTKITDNGNSTGHIGTVEGSNSDGKVTSTESYLENVVGYEGVSGSELILKYRQTFLNIDVMIINELEELFFTLW